jgi:hypothetical protein
MNENQLATPGSRFDLSGLEQIQAFVEVLKKDNALPSSIDNAGQYIRVLQAGKDMGLSVTEATEDIAIIRGKTSLYGPAVLARLRDFGYAIKWDESTATKCTVTVTHKETKETATESFTIEEAKSAGRLAKQGPRHTVPKQMLRYRAISFIVKFSFPEVMRGFAIAEEQQEVIDITPTATVKDPTTPAPSITTVVEGFTVKGEEVQLSDQAKGEPEVVEAEIITEETPEIAEIVEEIKEEEVGGIKEGSRVVHKLLKEGTVKEIFLEQAIVSFDRSPDKVKKIRLEVLELV